MENGMEEGIVKQFDTKKGYGFIYRGPGVKDLFVHYSAILAEGFRDLQLGDKVRFGVGQSSKGMEAVRVVKIGTATHEEIEAMKQNSRQPRRPQVETGFEPGSPRAKQMEDSFQPGDFPVLGRQDRGSRRSRQASFERKGRRGPSRAFSEDD